MSDRAASDRPGAAAQVPPHGRLVIDHVAHFVRDLDAASAALEAMGFALTPLSVQRNAGPGGALAPAGAANRCAMLAHGYLEFLTPMTAAGQRDTPIAAELRAAIDGHSGLHLLAFGSADVGADRARLVAEGFAPLEPVALQRTVPTPDGEATARFSVLRVKPGTMEEGRVQFVRHHTPGAIWQERWIAQPNGAIGLAGVVVAADEPDCAALRYARFTGRSVSASPRPTLATDRGILLFMTPRDAVGRLGIVAPAVGRFVASIVTCADISHFAAAAARAGCDVTVGPRAAQVALPPALGGTMLAIAPDTDPRTLAGA